MPLLQKRKNMAEERDVPTLEELANECDAIMARLDKDFPAGTEVSGASLMSEIKNTLLPLFKDIAAAAFLDIIDLQDEINPVKISQAQAEETADLLKAFAASRPMDPALLERISAALEPLEGDEDDEGEGEGEGDEEPEAN